MRRSYRIIVAKPIRIADIRRLHFPSDHSTDIDTFKRQINKCLNTLECADTEYDDQTTSHSITVSDP